MSFHPLVVWIGVLLASLAISLPGMGEEFPRFDQIQPVLEKYCYECHGYGSSEGGIDFESLSPRQDLSSLDAEAQKQYHDRWLAVWRNLRSQMMPPAEHAQPSADQRESIQRWIQGEVFHLDPRNPDPGRVTIRRLNREEYQYAIYDLFEHRFRATSAFPPDDTGYGFDTIGDVLSISPLLMEKYFEAAQGIAQDVVRIDPKKDHERYRRIFFEGPPPDDRQKQLEYARKILWRVGSRAFRRPVDEAALDRLVGIVKQISELEGKTFEDGMTQAVAAILTSPRFLFRAEFQADPDNPGAVVPLDEFALASRLSFFFWCSVPDQELLTLAFQGKLRDQLDQQIDRMLQDPKSERFVERFVGQWLRSADVETIAIDPRRALGTRDLGAAFREFNGRLREAMRRETEMLFEHILKENRPAEELLIPEYAFLNEDLAEFYGIDDKVKVQGRDLRKVDIPPGIARGGILTQGTFLVVTSNPTRTSPVKRGLFILENILGTPPPPAPANVPPLEEIRSRGRRLTMREQMELHRAEPLCNSCHARMDPLGLSLEQFTYIGTLQDEDDLEEIDTAGKLATGEEFDDVLELSRVLATQRRTDFYRCLVEKLMTFALGRGLEYYDTPTIDQIVERMEASDGGLRDAVRAVVHSAPFQKRRGDGNLLSVR